MKAIGAALLLAAMLPCVPVGDAVATSGERLAAAAQGELADSRIGRLLGGNSIVHPDFGCAFYRPDGTMMQYGRSGQAQEGRWRVRGDIYYSTGQCGRSGCRLAGQFPNLTFKRLDGGYEQPVLLILGNYCEKNGLFS